MKAITVRQPWGWAIMSCGKDVENRKGNIVGRYRGPLVIHTSKKPIGIMDPGRDLIRRVSGRLPLIEHPKTLGAAIGVVDLIGVHHSSLCFGDCDGPCSSWAMNTEWHLELANPRPLPEPIPYRGALGLWEFPDELLPEEYR